MRHLIIGDIHGCFEELQDLIQAAGISEGDQIIAIGDIVDRGPDSVRVLEFFTNTVGAVSLMGNHERKHVRSYRGQVRPALSQMITRLQIGEARYAETCQTMDRFPRYVELPEAILVHGFWEPGRSLGQQQESVIVGTLSGEGQLEQQLRRPWYEVYDGEKPLIVGHRDYLLNGQPMIYNDMVYAIDTGCCQGGRLTGLILPEFRIVSVRSRRDYWSEIKDRYAALRFAGTPDRQLTWEAAEKIADYPEDESLYPGESNNRVKHVRQLLHEGESAVSELFRMVEQRHREILNELGSEAIYASLSPKEQGSRYAAKIGKSPLAKFLHQIRLGRLQRDSIRRGFRGPAEAHRFLAAVLQAPAVEKGLIQGE